MRVQVLQRIEYSLFAAGFVCLALFLWTTGERNFYQQKYLRELEERDAGISTALYSAAPLRAGPLGRIEIPRADVYAAILDGVDAGTLDRAVGHVPGTAFPGADKGRVALAGHRDTFFKHLGDLQKGDTIRLAAGGSTHEYRVESIQVVKPTQTDVLAPTREPMLTLITCYPFQYVGSAPERFIVHARMVSRS